MQNIPPVRAVKIKATISHCLKFNDFTLTCFVSLLVFFLKFTMLTISSLSTIKRNDNGNFFNKYGYYEPAL